MKKIKSKIFTRKGKIHYKASKDFTRGECDREEGTV